MFPNQVFDTSNDYADDFLIPLTLSDYNEIKIKMQQKWPQSIHAVYFFENYLRWLKISSDICIKLYRTASKNCIIGYLADQKYIMAYNCDEGSNEIVGIFNSKLINFRDGFEFGAFQESQCDAMYRELERRGLNIEREVKSRMHYVSKDEALSWDTR